MEERWKPFSPNNKLVEEPEGNEENRSSEQKHTLKEKNPAMRTL
jgi:hypothetical protein